MLGKYHKEILLEINKRFLLEMLGLKRLALTYL